MPELIYDDSVKFNYSDGAHVYTVSKLVDKSKDLWTTETPVTGVTTIGNIIAKPALVGWASNLSAAYMVEYGAMMSQPKLARLAMEAKRQHIEAANKGKAAGSVGHALVEQLLIDPSTKGLALPTQPEARKAAISVIDAFKAWFADFEPQVVDSERPLYSLAHNFAGKFDLLAKIDGKLVLVDFKTTNAGRYAPDGVYAEMYCQLGGYLQLINEQLGMEVEEAVIVSLPKDGSNYKTKSLGDLGASQAEAKMYFLNALGLYNANNTFNYKLKG